MELNAILQCFLLAYCTTPHFAYNISPAELLCNRKLNTRLKPTLSNTITSHKSNFCRYVTKIIFVDFITIQKISVYSICEIECGKTIAIHKYKMD